MEKLALTVVVAAQKLRPYFQSQAIVILTTFPLGIPANWAVELSEYDIEYQMRTSAMSHVLSDFLVELPMEGALNQEPNSTWDLHVDGSSSKKGSGVWIRLTSPTGEVLEHSLQWVFHASNNESEYEALIADLQLAHDLKNAFSTPTAILSLSQTNYAESTS